MKLSTVIEEFINEMISKEDGEIELKRNELAVQFSCVPSQINYVISTRFSPERGYIVESRRGGGGYIRITKVIPSDGGDVLSLINLVGENISFDDAKGMIKNCFDYEILTEKEAKIILAAINEKSLSLRQPEQDRVRAKVLKNILINIM
ncbi:MAG: CtsR family transcriptional regulator [Oscillospiraceae bacterium]